MLTHAVLQSSACAEAVLDAADADPTLIATPSSRHVVAHCLLAVAWPLLGLPSAAGAKRPSPKMLSSYVRDQQGDSLWLWSAAARQLLQAPPVSASAAGRTGCVVRLLQQLRTAVIATLEERREDEDDGGGGGGDQGQEQEEGSRSIGQGAHSVTWVQVLASLVPLAQATQGLPAPPPSLGAPDSLASLADVVQLEGAEAVRFPPFAALAALIRQCASEPQVDAWLATLTRLFKAATAAVAGMDRSLELVSQSFACPLPAVHAGQCAVLLVELWNAAGRDSDDALAALRQRPKVAAEFLETTNTLLATVCGPTLIDLEPPVARMCHLAYELGHRVEVASDLNIILDAPRCAALMLRGTSVRRVLSFSQLTPYQPPSQLAITTARLEEAKVECLQFVRLIITQQPQLMAGDLGHVVLDAYGGSVLQSDAIALQVLLLAESKGMSLSRMLLITGPGTSAVRKSFLARGVADAVDPMALEGLSRLDPQRLAYSAANMHRLPSTAAGDAAAKEGGGVTAAGAGADAGASWQGAPLRAAMAYDPMFMLPLLRSIVSVGGSDALFEFVERNGAQYCFAALSLPSTRLRLLASATLAAFAGGVAQAKRKELKQLQMTVKLFQESVVNPGEQLPCIVASFAAECCRLSLHPGALPLYPIVMKVCE